MEEVITKTKKNKGEETIKIEPAKTLIYIINHAYAKYGERVEILEYKEGEFYYLRSMINEM